ncbi:PH domain-containing protein [Qipengyuania spongiae]|uniref:PH domain-containing protein n=1 Tax=Qipengyuania spongiae TaxID=2909673 RepID=A0ABY5T1W5_9SPHN|nr:PH domain-containing protein [Qipengyuania spongiae]UVI40076.1 PH domain-containing protein [Qipengyuania spongiae]
MEHTDALQAAPVEETDLRQLDPRYRTVLRIVGTIWSIPVLIVATVPGIAIENWSLYALVPALVTVALLIFRFPSRRWSARGYSLEDERLRVVRGIMFRFDTVVPFGRVQHIDVGQGPLERAFDLATLTVHTAGTHNSSVALPGLAHEDALAMRETIRAAIRRDTL